MRTSCRRRTPSGSRLRGRPGAGARRRSSWSGCAYGRVRGRSPPCAPPLPWPVTRCGPRSARCGQTEREIAGLLEGHLRRLGSEAHPFPTIVASGPRTAWPHARTSARPVARGEWLLLDFGAQVDGYCADITRTVVVGARATDAQRVLYDLVHTAQRTAREGVRARMSGREADALARDLIDARGFGDAFGHSLGHGLGL